MEQHHLKEKVNLFTRAIFRAAKKQCPHDEGKTTFQVGMHSSKSSIVLSTESMRRSSILPNR